MLLEIHIMVILSKHFVDSLYLNLHYLHRTGTWKALWEYFLHRIFVWVIGTLPMRMCKCCKNVHRVLAWKVNERTNERNGGGRKNFLIVFTGYRMVEWWRQRGTLKHWTVPNWCGWLPKKILSRLVTTKASSHIRVGYCTWPFYQLLKLFHFCFSTMGMKCWCLKYYGDTYTSPV
jgi:hypothetical protein